LFVERDQLGLQCVWGARLFDSPANESAEAHEPDGREIVRDFQT
jgi:hypothetical protein